MKRDIVFADEIIDSSLGVVPPLLPRIILSYVVRPLYAGRQVTYNRLEPDVQPLRLEPVQRDWDPPLDIAGDGSATQTCLHIVAGEIDHIRSPVLFSLPQVSGNLLLQTGQVQKEMFRLLLHWCAAIYPAARAPQL